MCSSPCGPRSSWPWPAGCRRQPSRRNGGTCASSSCPGSALTESGDGRRDDIRGLAERRGGGGPDAAPLRTETSGLSVVVVSLVAYWEFVRVRVVCIETFEIRGILCFQLGHFLLQGVVDNLVNICVLSDRVVLNALID